MLKPISVTAFLALSLTTAYASEFKTPIHVPAVITKSSGNNSYSASMRVSAPMTSDVFLMNIALTKAQRHKLQTFKSAQKIAMTANTPSRLPSKVELGMNNVPVLDQGMHGTCVTFATTAALDALLYKRDYISPLCSLAIGSYLESRSYIDSGWEGSYGPLILERYSDYGVVNLDKQRAQSCAGLTEYPRLNMNNTGTSMSIDDYAKLSEDITFDLSWYSLITEHERFSENAPADQMDNILIHVKQLLAANNAKENLRFTFGTLIPLGHCSVGACGTHNKQYDTWVLSKAIIDDKEPDFAGHEMVITGYDDNAKAMDNEGAVHIGLLTLRNSWGDNHGDNGDYYMSYDFFKQYVMEVQAINK